MMGLVVVVVVRVVMVADGGVMTILCIYLIKIKYLIRLEYIEKEVSKSK